MKNPTLFFTILSLVSWLPSVGQSEFIVDPDKTLLSYLHQQYTFAPDTTYLLTPDWMGEKRNCGYQIQFSEGISFTYDKECTEDGEEISVLFPKKSLSEVQDIIHQLFTTQDYDWYENGYEYRPEMYYERMWAFYLRETENGVVLRVLISTV